MNHETQLHYYYLYIYYDLLLVLKTPNLIYTCPRLIEAL